MYEVIAVKISPRPISTYCGVCHQIDRLDIGSGRPSSEHGDVALPGSGPAWMRAISTTPAATIEAAAKQKPTPILPSMVIGMPSRASSGYTPPSTTGMSSMITTESKTLSVAGDSVVPSTLRSIWQPWITKLVDICE